MHWYNVYKFILYISLSPHWLSNSYPLKKVDVFLIYWNIKNPFTKKEKNKKSYKQFDATFYKLRIVKPVEENRW